LRRAWFRSLDSGSWLLVLIDQFASRIASQNASEERSAAQYGNNENGITLEAAAQKER
jgi:hypothetical protein